MKYNYYSSSQNEGSNVEENKENEERFFKNDILNEFVVIIMDLMKNMVRF